MMAPALAETWRRALDGSRERVRAVDDDGTVVTQATGARVVAAWTLAPAPTDPVRHLEVAHAQARGHLERSLEHGRREAASVMTEQLFTRLTDPRPAPLRARGGVTRYTYTPRKALRRVLDHALDHLNQIDQWLAWRRNGVVPTPTDGWVPSSVTLAEDRLPLTRPDLDAWLWRIDQAARLVVRRAAALEPAELDWTPPEGWPLRRVLHHLARSERLYAAALDEALPEEPALRYAGACRLLDASLAACDPPVPEGGIVYPGLYGVLQTPEEVVAQVLAMEAELLAETPG
jgi:hypothetical protein